jgi:phage shock protein E
VEPFARVVGQRPEFETSSARGDRASAPYGSGNNWHGHSGLRRPSGTVSRVRPQPGRIEASAHGQPGAIHTASRALLRLRRAAAAAGITVLLGAGCGGAGEDAERSGSPPSADLVGPDEFAERMTDPEAVVVNVHVPYEGEIAGTDLFIPFEEIASSPRLPSERDQPLVLYCRTGNMSAEAASDLVDAGYTDVTDLEGGMLAWEASGRSIEVDRDRAGAPG